MQCKYHPKRQAEFFCATCNAPLCKECAEEVRPREYRCYECAMLHSVSEVGTSMRERHEKGEDRRLRKKGKWGPFHYFVIVSSVLIGVMWGVIIFGGQKAPPTSIEHATKGRVLLFMVDGAIRRFALYEGNRYPEQLVDLIPKYLSLRDREVSHLKKLSYQRDAQRGYRLTLANPTQGQMNIILSPKGVEYTTPASGGA
jgi:hypothetical protein